MHRVGIVTRHSKALFALGALLTAAPVYSGAQATLLGSVHSDSSNIPLTHAEVAIPVLRLGSYTDSAGRFRMDHITPGEYEVIVRQLGFLPKIMRMTFESDETTAQQFQLSPSPTILARVKVLAPDTARSLEVANTTAFNSRKAKGFGFFVTPDELYAAREHDMTTVLHTIPQVRFYRLPTGAVVAGSTESGNRCYAQVYLDGVKINYAFDVNSITPGSLRGIEFYATLNAPSDYPAGPNYCGVLVLWTRLKGR